MQAVKIILDHRNNHRYNHCNETQTVSFRIMTRKLSDFPVNLTNSQRKALNASATMRHLRTAVHCGDIIENVWVDRVDGMSQDFITVQTISNVFDWIITPRGRIIAERTQRRR